MRSDSHAAILTADGLTAPSITIVGAGGDDQLSGSQLQDSLSGGDGDDTLLGLRGVDHLDGGAGDDVLNGGSGNDRAYGGDGEDNLTGGSGDDILLGGGGNDTLVGGSGFDTASYEDRANAVIVDLTGQVAGVGGEADTFVSIEGLVGGRFDDKLYGDSAANMLDGSHGDDTIEGGGGADTLRGGEGNDRVSASSDFAASSLLGGEGDDTLAGGARSILRGGDGQDRLVPGAGQGFGGAGDDVFSIGTDATTVDGGSGSDAISLFVQVSGGGAQSFNVDLHNEGTSVSLGGHEVVLISIEDVLGGSGSDSFTGNDGANRLEGGYGEDTLIGEKGNDLLITDVTQYGDEQADLASGGNGRDTLLAGNYFDTLSGGRGADLFEFTKPLQANASEFSATVLTDLGAKDTIDLSAIDAEAKTAGDQAFHIVSVFSGVRGELVLVYNADLEATFVEGDVSGDGKADLYLRLDGDHRDFSNFVL